MGSLNIYLSVFNVAWDLDFETNEAGDVIDSVNFNFKSK